MGSEYWLFTFIYFYTIFKPFNLESYPWAAGLQHTASSILPNPLGMALNEVLKWESSRYGRRLAPWLDLAPLSDSKLAQLLRLARPHRGLCRIWRHFRLGRAVCHSFQFLELKQSCILRLEVLKHETLHVVCRGWRRL